MTAETEGRTLYEVLGVEPDASEDEIKKVFRKQMRKYHPDVYGPEGTEISAGISAAYNVLVDPEARAEYDRELSGEPTEEEAAEEPVPFEPDWGQEDEWTAPPEDETEEETPADPASDEDVPEDWAEETVLDDVVVDEPPTPPAPGPSPAPGSAPAPGPEDATAQKRGSHPLRKGDGRSNGKNDGEPAKPTFTHPGLYAHYALVIGLGALLVPVFFVLSDWAAGPQALTETTGRRVVGVALGALLGLALGVFLRKSEEPPKKVRPGTKPRPVRPQKANVAPAVIVGVAAVVAGRILAPSAWGALAAMGMAVVIAAAAAYVAVYWLAQRKRLDRVVKMEALKKSNLFGALPGGVEAELVNRDMVPLLHASPAVRAFRTPENTAPFSHILVQGNRVALVRGLVTGSGLYFWSGPSLLREVPGYHPVEVTRVRYREGMQKMKKAVGSKVELKGWLLIFDTDRGTVRSMEDPSMPVIQDHQAGAEQISEWLAEGGNRVDQRVVVEALIAANS